MIGHIDRLCLEFNMAEKQQALLGTSSLARKKAGGSEARGRSGSMLRGRGARTSTVGDRG